MKKLFACILALLSNGAFAQWTSNWNDTYQHTSTNGYSNEARKTITDPLGNVYVLADVTSNLDTNSHPTPLTQYYVVLRKYNFSGNLVVQKLINVKNMSLSGTSYRSAYGLLMDASSNIYVGFTRNNSSGNYFVEVIKYNSSLVSQWVSDYNAAGNSYGVDMTLNGNIVYSVVKTVNGANTTYAIIKSAQNGVVGLPLYSFDANVDVVNDIIFNGSRTVYVTGSRLVSGYLNIMTASVTIGPFGVALDWKNMFNNSSVTGNDWGTGLVMGSDGYIYVMGTTYVNAVNGNDGVVLKYRAGGALQGTIFLNQSSVADVGGAIATGASGFIYVSCSNATQVSVYQISLSIYHTVASAFFTPTPVAAYTSVTNISVNDMKVSPNGNVYVTGGVSANAVAGNFSAGYLTKFGPSGFVFRELNSQPVEGDFTSSFEGVSIALDPSHNNNIVWLRSNWKTFTTHNSEKVFVDNLSSGGLLRSGNGDGQDINAGMDNQLSFYPNPAHGVIYWNSNEQPSEIRISDVTGKTVLELRPAVGNSLDISVLQPGIYFAGFTNEKGTLVKRIVVN